MNASLGEDEEPALEHIPLPHIQSSALLRKESPSIRHKQTLVKPVWVLFHDSQKVLARNVVNYCQRWQYIADKTDYPNAPERMKTRDIEYKEIIKWGKFRDGFPNLFIQHVKEIAGKDVIFIASFHNVEVIFEQISIIWALPRYRVNSLTVVLPYFPTGTMERVDSEGQVATANTLAKFLSTAPMTSRGPVQYMIYDIHALQERFYFSENVVPRLETAMPLLIDGVAFAIEKEPNEWCHSRLSIAFPDEGAKKRFDKHFPRDWPRIICNKTRLGDARVVRMSEGVALGRDILIIDDLVQTGGTLLETIKLLQKEGARSLNCFVTHAVFPQESWRKFTDPNVNVRRFFITDSIPHATEISKHEPFELLSLGGQVAESLLGYDLKLFL